MVKYMGKEEKKDKVSVNKMWGGRFSSESNRLMDAINVSIHFDKRLAMYDLVGSEAHVMMLSSKKIISQDECNLILDGLSEIRKELNEGTFKFYSELEDIHMNIEARLKELVGEVGGKIHTARSRNDQVSTDLRLWIREASGELCKEITNLMVVILGKAEGESIPAVHNV